ncbi:DEAD/DEAH box helicase [Microbacterium sp. ASV49]|uniref:DEAD/DEAH box helicase n=1 Tax=Microbacterium candidum TaxID=3041922 RepID=A0ABT7MVY2_9MICO|nr:DEAD/DEAH box helicase [Microbacterium sp. ASV49]MDL9978603.1 DEAD/DEAH box helicase [Microbacterium sp. ASV49]
MPLSRDELQRLRMAIEEVGAWSKHAAAIANHRARVTAEADIAFRALQVRMTGVSVRNGSRWTVLPLRDTDSTQLGLLTRQTSLPVIAGTDAALFAQLTREVPRALSEAVQNFGFRKLFSGAQSRATAERAGRYLVEYQMWGATSGVAATLQRLDDRASPAPGVAPAYALRPVVGLAQRLTSLGVGDLVPGASVTGLPAAVRTIQGALESEGRYRQQAVDAGVALRRAEAQKVIAEMPVDRLREATRERIRITPLSDAGIRTVQDVFTYADRLASIPGIGDTSAHRIRGAAQTLWQTTYEEMPVRIDIAKPKPQTFDLVRELATWDASRKTKNATGDVARAVALGPLAAALDSHVIHLAVFGAGAHAFSATVDAVVHRAESISGAAAGSTPSDPWQDFLARPADYFAMLQELGFLTEDEDAVAGGLPEEIVAAVREFELETENLSVSLRGYQGFAARFALVQRKVIIGDEMGLGKTIEALAVFAHLRSKGSHHFLVICPAAVVTNWVREVHAKSALRAHRLHGPSRADALQTWQRQGGVAVTTYESLGWLEPHLAQVEELACVALDEAHYIKNPGALRARRSARVIDQADRAVLLSGTPLENRVEEFRTLVDYIRPDLVVDASELRPRLFRQQVAPAYLRRNQEDVLTELPELVEVEEWLPLSHADAIAYRDAVMTGNFQAMRQAAMLQGDESEKLQRLVEVVEEAEDNGRKVIVFSNYLNVLDEVAAALPGAVFGPLTGAVPAAKRQTIVDEFSAAGAGAVLVSQIVAGGVGLNIQSASVIVICEPQLKPTTEWQAIARARRMGQLHTVQVHRLLSEEGVDTRIMQILAKKRELFSDFAAISETAEAAPEAFDVSEAELVREVIESERERLFSGAIAEV